MNAPRSLIAVVLLLALAAAAADGIWLDVPFVAQEKHGCGAAALAMLMQYWRPAEPADPVQIQKQLYSPQARGIFASDLTAFLRQNDYRTFVLQGTWDDLKAQLEKGRPLIVALGTIGGSRELHYVVVTGLDWRNQLVMLNDPAGGRKLRKMDRAHFEKAWKGTGHWLLLAVPQHP